jgi:hypothetical protein
VDGSGYIFHQEDPILTRPYATSGTINVCLSQDQEEAVSTGIRHFLGLARSRGYEVTELRCDGEKSVASITDALGNEGVNFELKTQRLVTRDQFIVLPMPDLVIDFINAIATKQGIVRGADPTVEPGDPALLDRGHRMLDIDRPDARNVPDDLVVDLDPHVGVDEMLLDDGRDEDDPHVRDESEWDRDEGQLPPDDEQIEPHDRNAVAGGDARQEVIEAGDTEVAEASDAEVAEERGVPHEPARRSSRTTAGKFKSVKFADLVVVDILLNGIFEDVGVNDEHLFAMTLRKGLSERKGPRGTESGACGDRTDRGEESVAPSHCTRPDSGAAREYHPIVDVPEGQVLRIGGSVRKVQG